MKKKQVGIIMGSESDYSIMQSAKQQLDMFDVSHEMQIVSAHRTPDWMLRYAKQASELGFKVIIAGAGGAAHLPGMVASLTELPVIGVPIYSTGSLQGLDSLLSIVQMPKGIPVATVAVDNATNAALLAVRILAISDAKLKEALLEYMQQQSQEVMDKNQQLFA